VNISLPLAPYGLFRYSAPLRDSSRGVATEAVEEFHSPGHTRGKYSVEIDGGKFHESSSQEFIEEVKRLWRKK
jgi:hypothetical protein